MTETTPDPAATGTDRGGCTCGESDAVGDTTPGPCFVDASGFTVHRPRTDEHEDHGKHLRGLWRDLADKDIQHGVDWPGVVRVLFADIDALTAGVEFSTGTDRVELTDAERAQRLLTGIRERDDDAAALRFINGWMKALTADRDELAQTIRIQAKEADRDRAEVERLRKELSDRG